MPFDPVSEVVAALIAMLAAPIAAIVTWRLFKRRNVAESEGAVAQGATVAVEVMLKAITRLEGQVSALELQNRELRAEVARFREMIRNMGGDPSKGGAE